MSVTIEDFQTLHSQLLQLKTENFNLQEQISIAKKRSNLSPQQIAENLKNSNLQIRVRISQCMKEREKLNSQLKFVKIAKFLQTQNLSEAVNIPEINSIPSELKQTAKEIYELIDDVKQQIVRRAFLETQINELGKKSKSLGRTGENLQSQVDNLRMQQKSEQIDVDKAKETMQRLESETTSLREMIQMNNIKQNNFCEDDLKNITKKIENLEKQRDERKEKHKTFMNDINLKIEEYDRNLEDAHSSKIIMEKKLHQKIWAIQAEINKRRGIIVYSTSKTTKSDSTNMFLESKKLIEQITKKQQEVWELEERASFSKNSLVLVAKEIVNSLISNKDNSIKTQKIKSISQNILLNIAKMERLKNEIIKSQQK